MVSILFTDPSTVIVHGTAVLEFAGSGRRLVRFGDNNVSWVRKTERTRASLSSKWS